MTVLSVAQMYKADQSAVAAGVAGVALMEAAGGAIVDAVQARWSKRPVVVLAGPGNNGGDGFVVARLLKAAKWPVTVYLLGDKANLKGDAAVHAKRWRAKVLPLDQALERLVDASPDVLVIDALFGAGLSKPLRGAAKSIAEVLNLQETSVVSVDIPSGVDGDTGQKRKGIAFQADLTVTFCRPKPGHLLMPGRQLCGEVVVADIGIADSIVSAVAKTEPTLSLNSIELWGGVFPHLSEDANKYTRGHALILGGPVMTGAARMAALAARRMGAGLVSIAVPSAAFPIYASSIEPGTLISSFNTLKEFKKILSDERKNVCILGPGAGLGKATRDKVMAALKARKRVVLDADALTAFKDSPTALFKSLEGFSDDAVLTPHGGEFARLFPDLAKKQASLGKLQVTRMAAKRAGAVVLYKGADTVVASPDGRAAITTNAPPTLATAGTGDVLSGFIGGLLSQGMPAFEATNAAAWLHAECANSFGPGLIAEDLIDELPANLIGLFYTFSQGAVD